MATFDGSADSEVLAGSADSDVLNALGGDDTLDGGAGADYLYGGDGNDVFIYDAADITVAGQAGTDTWDASAQTADLTVNLTPYLTMENFTAGSGNDSILGNGNANVLTGGTGNDTLYGGAGADTLDGGAGADYLYGGDGNDVFIYDAADITVAGQAGTDTWDASAQTANLTVNLTPYLTMENFTAGSGNDSILGNGNANVIIGGAGNDTIDGGTGADYLYGGDGNDVFIYDAADITVAGQAGTDTWDASAQTANLTINLTPYATMENFVGGSGNDSILGNGNANVLTGGAGNDTLAGGAGSDTYSFSKDGGSDVVVSDAGNSADTVSITDAVKSALNFALNGNDLVITVTGGSGSLTLKDWKLGGGYATGTILATDGAATVTLPESGAIAGTAGNDPLSGTTGSDTIYGLAGDDTLDGGAGADYLYGGDGNDVFIYDAADITVAGQAGTDTWNASAQTANLTVNLTPYATMENFVGGSGNDSILGNGNANLILGGAGNDTLDGGAGADSLYGGDGNDVFIYDAADITVAGQAGTDTWDASAQTANLTVDLTPYLTMENFTGGSGADFIAGNGLANVIRGGAGNDTIGGGAGNDSLYGGAGNDLLSGGDGADVYYYGAGDGDDVIAGSALNSQDTLCFYNVMQSQLNYSYSGNDLVVTVDGASGSLTLKDWKLGTGNQIAFQTSDATFRPHQFNIQFDYRFDTAGGITAPVRALLDTAAAYWENRIIDDFTASPAGTTVSGIIDPATFNYTSAYVNYAVDDLLIFVSSITPPQDPSYEGILGLGGPISGDADGNFEPSYGQILFNIDSDWFLDPTPSTSSDIPWNLYDFIAVATHEIGHVLGIGTSPAFSSYVGGSSFLGPNAMQANGGLPVPLDTSLAHVNNTDDLMYPYSYPGDRPTPSAVDLGILADIGYRTVT